ncbi:hypothetical protein THASP1DRAFT_33117 [Thamnocephalis sphaerospora]|uniref:Yeast cell wall synthesis Kre9/Knh1-like N-terminal domain-containing protein n=1 Tax=Thamnocephalis sphaerospora TaxID=78915 RepID=A0A4P9XHB1_9FUNG|nr:hypothetical protein THASP1DRAFT_33117 [Thamnocephalis sphaerospora]|eukprot:RKP05053.1 hypothetical protein THASP1DRAFT_33117 [Thamnocephalis sphaerospora]
MLGYSVISACAAVLLALPAVHANFYVTSPTGDSVWQAGVEQTITWIDDGQVPSLEDMSYFKLELQTGSEMEQTTLSVVGTDLDPKAKLIHVTIPPEIAPPGEYFFRLTPSNGDIRWTGRFKLENAGSS